MSETNGSAVEDPCSSDDLAVEQQPLESTECGGGELGSDGSISGDVANTVVSTEKFTCPHCSERYHQPRVIHCLHVFCTPCLEKLSSEEPPGDREKNSGSNLQHIADLVIIACPICGQETRVRTITELPRDLVLMNLMDIDDIRALRMFCTSCKAQEKAVARCRDCASFLCPSCVTAHKFMRCFGSCRVTLS